MKEKIIKILKLPDVPNICQEILREVWKSRNASIAHVIVLPGRISLLHKHKKFTELYYILKGKGIIWIGKEKFKVRGEMLIEIPPNTPHKLKNTGKRPLRHLVISVPPFNPKDLFLLKEKK